MDPTLLQSIEGFVRVGLRLLAPFPDALVITTTEPVPGAIRVNVEPGHPDNAPRIIGVEGRRIKAFREILDGVARTYGIAAIQVNVDAPRPVGRIPRP